jgi:ribosomal protein S19E (S16A)
MTHEKLALLRALAARPSLTVAPCLQLLLDELAKAGYVAKDQSAGWMTTAQGCELIESARRSVSYGCRRSAEGTAAAQLAARPYR